MKKLLLTFVLASSVVLASPVTRNEENALKKEFKLYVQTKGISNYRMRNYAAKREMAIAKTVMTLPVTSKVAFGDEKYDSARDWSVTDKDNGIDYFAVVGTSRRKAIQKIDGKFVVLFYQAVSKNKDMVEDTFDEVRDALRK